MIRQLVAVSLSALALAAAQTETQAAAPAPNWTGFYVGLSAGGRFADNSWTTTDVAPTLATILTTDPNPSASFDSFAARFGGYLGYNWSITPYWIVGIEGDFGWADNRKSRAPVPGTVQSDTVVGFAYMNQPRVSVNETWDASVRGRVGMLVSPNTLVFTAVGAAWQQIDLTATCPASGGATDWCTVPQDESHRAARLGWTAGGGIERMFGHWILRLEYRYADFGTIRHTFFTYDPAALFDDRFTSNVDVRTHTVIFGIAYMFDEPRDGVSAINR